MGHSNTVSILLHRGADPNVKTEVKPTYFYFFVPCAYYYYYYSFYYCYYCLWVLSYFFGGIFLVLSQDQCTPLYVAFAEGHVETQELLIRFGADVNAKTKVCDFFLFSLFFSFFFLFFSFLFSLFFQMESNPFSFSYPSLPIPPFFSFQTGATPLYIAAQRGDAEGVSLLIVNGADVNETKNVFLSH